MCVIHIFLHSVLKWRHWSKTTRKRQKSEYKMIYTAVVIMTCCNWQLCVFMWRTTNFYIHIGMSNRYRFLWFQVKTGRKKRKILPGYHINNVVGRKGKLSYADENAIIISYYRWIELLLIWLSESAWAQEVSESKIARRKRKKDLTIKISKKADRQRAASSCFYRPHQRP